MMKIWAMTDVGLVRKDNQDAYGTEFHAPSGHTVCVVCDGMGGAAGGQLASHIAVTTFMEEMRRTLRPDMTPEELKELSAYAVAAANRAVREAAMRSVDCRSMGTTLVSAVSWEGGAVISNVGDSRAYYVTETEIIRVTKDHSLVETMVDHGDITADEARHHPSRNLITRALGRDTNAACDSFIRPMESGSYILLCTDGLVNTVTDQEMLFEIIHGDNQETCLKRLLEIAKNQGAPDNVTAVLMQKL